MLAVFVYVSLVLIYGVAISVGAARTRYGRCDVQISTSLIKIFNQMKKDEKQRHALCFCAKKLLRMRKDSN